MNEDRKIISYKWRSGREPVGFVLVEEEDLIGIKQLKAYVGVCMEGNTEQQDAEFIADYGARLTLLEAAAFFPEEYSARNNEGSTIKFSFTGESVPIVEMKPGGNIYIRGNHIATDAEIVDGFREFMEKMRPELDRLEVTRND